MASLVITHPAPVLTDRTSEPEPRRAEPSRYAWAERPDLGLKPTPDAVRPAGDALRVLLVEDNTSLRTSLRELLEDEGYDVVAECDDGEAGVRAAGELAPDVVLMDLKMPRMDGIEATRRIRAVAPRTRVLIMSAYLDDTLERWAREAGAYAFVGKAASFDRLHRLLLEAAGRSA